MFNEWMYYRMFQSVINSNKTNPIKIPKNIQLLDANILYGFQESMQSRTISQFKHLSVYFSISTKLTLSIN